MVFTSNSGLILWWGKNPSHEISLLSQSLLSQLSPTTFSLTNQSGKGGKEGWTANRVKRCLSTPRLESRFPEWNLTLATTSRGFIVNGVVSLHIRVCFPSDKQPFHYGYLLLIGNAAKTPFFALKTHSSVWAAITPSADCVCCCFGVVVRVDGYDFPVVDTNCDGGAGDDADYVMVRVAWWCWCCVTLWLWCGGEVVVMVWWWRWW